jgi:transcriptional regulator with XRE-family HTH domain
VASHGNDQLKHALTRAGLTADDLARVVEVDEKTVERWLSGRVPYTRHRARVARALSSSENELWPTATPPAPAPAPTPVELIAGYAHSADAHPDPTELIAAASERVWLLDFTLASILDRDNVPELLGDKAKGGVQVRLLISNAARARLAIDTPVDEPYPDPEPPAALEIARARGHIQTLIDHPNVQARKFATMRFNTIIRADEQMLVIHHLWGQPPSQAPAIHLRRSDTPGLFAQYEAHYDAIWTHASHPIDSDPDLFPDPREQPDYYQSLRFDDSPPDPAP